MLAGFLILFSSRSFWLLQLAYFVAALLLLAGMDSDIIYQASADVASWIAPARALLTHQAFVLLGQPDVIDIYRPPLVPMFNAIFLWIGGNFGFKLIIIAQTILLSLTATMTGLIANRLRSGIGVFAAALVLFNPNSLSTALLLQSETLFTFFLIISCAFLLFIIQTQKWQYAIGCAVALSFATLCRPTTQYLVVLMPFILPTLLLIQYGPQRFLYRWIGLGMFASIISTVILLPWAFFVGKVEGKPTLVSSEISSIYVRDQLITLESYTSGLSIDAVSKKMKAEEAGLLRNSCNELRLNSPDRVTCFQAALKSNWKSIRGYAYLDYLRAMGRSILSFTMSGGAGNWHNIISANQSVDITSAWSSSEQGNAAFAFFRSLSQLNNAAIFISLTCILMSTCLKIFAVIGFADLLRRREFLGPMIFFGVCGYFIATTLFLGQSRYRVPVEPYISILAAFGYLTVYEFFQKMKRYF